MDYLASLKAVALLIAIPLFHLVFSPTFWIIPNWSEYICHETLLKYSFSSFSANQMQAFPAGAVIWYKNSHNVRREGEGLNYNVRIQLEQLRGKFSLVLSPICFLILKLYFHNHFTITLPKQSYIARGASCKMSVECWNLETDLLARSRLARRLIIHRPAASFFNKLQWF